MAAARAAVLPAIVLAFAAPAVAGCSDGEAGDSITVAAASSLRPALDRVAEEFERRHVAEVTISYGSSGQLAQQIRNGAPFSLFASASGRYVGEVLEAGHGDPASRRVYAHGRLALWSREGTPLELSALAEPGVERIAIANPEHAPYGRAAQEALISAGLFDELAGKLVRGESVAGAMRLAESGNVDAALVAASFAAAAGDGEWILLPERLHRPIRQTLVVLAEEGAERRSARAFAGLLSGSAGRRILRRNGFSVPPTRRGPIGRSHGQPARASRPFDPRLRRLATLATQPYRERF